MATKNRGYALLIGSILSVATPRNSRADCQTEGYLKNTGPIFVNGALASEVDLVWNGSDFYQYPIDITFEANAYGPNGLTAYNCAVDGHMSLAGVGAAQGTNFPSAYQFGHFWQHEMQSSILAPAYPVHLGAPFGLGVTLSSLTAVSSFPQVGSIDFWWEQNGDVNCPFQTWESFSASDCGVFLVSVPIKLTLAPWIQSMPVLFN